MKLNRRQFMKVVSGTALAAALPALPSTGEIVYHEVEEVVATPTDEWVPKMMGVRPAFGKMELNASTGMLRDIPDWKGQLMVTLELERRRHGVLEERCYEFCVQPDEHPMQRDWKELIEVFEGHLTGDNLISMNSQARLSG